MNRALICKSTLAGVLLCIASGDLSGLYAQQSNRPISTPDKNVSRELWDVWRQGFDFYEDGEMKMIAGKYEEALPLYRKSLTAFESVRKQNPKWNRSVITYRISLSKRRIATVQRKLEESGHSVKEINPDNVSSDKTVVARLKAQAKSDETARTNQILKQQLTKLETDTQTLRQEAQRGNEALKQIKGLLAEREQMEKQIASLRLNVNKLLEEQKKLSPRTAELERLLASEQARSGKYSETIRQSNKELSQLKERLADTAKEKKKIDEQYAELKQRLGSEKKVAEDYQKRQMSRIEELSASLDRQSEARKSLEKKLKNTNELLEERTKSLEIMKIEAQKLREGQLPVDTLKRLERANARLTEEVAILKKASEKAEIVREASAKEIASLRSERDKLKRDLASNIEQRNDYSKANDVISKQFSELSKKYNQLADLHASQTVKLEQIQKERNLFASRINEQDAEMNNSRKRIQDLQKNIAELSSGLRASQGKNLAYVKERTALLQQIQERDDSLQRTRQEIADFRKKLAAASESAGRITVLEGELSAAKQNITGREKQIADLNAALQAERMKNTAAKLEAEKIAAVFSERLRNEQVKGAELSAQVASLKTKLSSAELSSVSSAKLLQAQLEESEKKLQARSQELQKCSGELQRCSAELNVSRELLEKQKKSLAELDTVRKNQTTLTAELGAAKASLKAVMEQSAKDVQLLAEMKVKAAEAEKQLLRAEQGLKLAQTERDSLKTSQSLLSAENNRKVAVLESELKSLQKQLASAQAIAKASVPAERQVLMEQETKRLTADIAELKKQLASVSAEKNLVAQESQENKAENVRMKTAAAKSASEMAQLKAENARSGAETSRLRSEVARAGEELDRIRKESLKNQQTAESVRNEMYLLKAELAKIRSESAKANSAEIASLQAQLKDAEGKLLKSAESDRELARSKAEIASLQTRLKEAENNLRKSAGPDPELTKSKTEISVLQVQLKEAEKKLVKASEPDPELAKSKAEIASLQAQLKEAEIKLAKAMEPDPELAKAKAETVRLQAESIRLNAETTRLKEVAAKNRQDSLQARAEVLQLKESISKLQEKAGDDSVKEEIRKQLSGADTKLKETMLLLAEQKVLSEKEHAALLAAEAKMKDLNSQAGINAETLRSVREANTALQNEVKNTAEKLKASEASVSALRKAVETISTALASSEKNNALLKAELAELRKNAQGSAQADIILKKELAALKGSLDSSAAELVQLKQKLADTEKMLQGSRKESAASTELLSESKKALAESLASLTETQKQLASSSRRVRELDAEKKVLLEDLQKFQGSISEKDRIRMMQNALKTLNEKLEKSEQEKNSAENNLRRLHEQLGHAQSTMRTLRRNIASQDAMIASLRSTAAQSATSAGEVKRLQSELAAVKSDATKMKTENGGEINHLKTEIGRKAKEVFDLREELMKAKQTAAKLAKEKSALEESNRKNEVAIASLKTNLATEQTKEGKQILRKRIQELIEEQKKLAAASDSDLMKAVAAKNEALDEAFRVIEKEQEQTAVYRKGEETLRLQSTHLEKQMQQALNGAKSAAMEVQKARAELTMLQQNIDDGLVVSRTRKKQETPVRITVHTIVPEKVSKAYAGEMTAGRNAESAGDDASALYHYWRAADTQPAKAEPYQALLQLHLRRKEWTEAEQAYQNALKNGAMRNSNTENLFKQNLKK